MPWLLTTDLNATLTHLTHLTHLTQLTAAGAAITLSGIDRFLDARHADGAVVKNV